MRPAGAVLILLLGLAACRRDGRSAEEVPESAETPVEAFFRYGPVTLGETSAAVRAALGQPDSVVTAPVPNRHDPAVTDSLSTLYYRGLRAEFFRAGYDGRELLSALDIFDDRYLRPDSPLRMGMAEAEVRLALGEPSTAAGGVLGYVCSSCDAAGNDVLELRLLRGQLQRITLRYWLD